MHTITLWQWRINIQIMPMLCMHNISCNEFISPERQKTRELFVIHLYYALNTFRIPLNNLDNRVQLNLRIKSK